MDISKHNLAIEKALLNNGHITGHAMISRQFRKTGTLGL